MKRLFLIAALALLPLPALAVCEQKAPWAKGYDYFESIPTIPQKIGVITSGPMPVRKGAGFDSTINFSLPAGAKVVKHAEQFDRACNQWVQVSIHVIPEGALQRGGNGGTFWGWILGTHLRTFK